MNALDILIILIFVSSIIYGYIRGVIIQLGSVGGIFLGIVLCRLFGDALTNVFTSDTASPQDGYVATVFANVILFIIGYIIAVFLSKIVKVVSTKLRLTPLDRIGGALFSLFEWFFIFSLLLNVWQALDKQTDITGGSKLFDGRAAVIVVDLAPRVVGSDTAHVLWNYLPDKRHHDRR